MSIPYEETGRRSQKARTKAALVESARRLIGDGLTPTVEQAAAEAGVSRTTAYRYFPNQRALLVAAYPYIDSASLLPDPAPTGPEERLAAMVDAHTKQTLEMEHQLRTMLRLSLEAGPEERGRLLLRRGRAVTWILDALAPLRGRLTDAQLHRLALAIRTVEGIDALVWLTDVAGLSRPDAVRLMRWAALALLRSALTHDPPPTAGARTIGRPGLRRRARTPRR